MIDALLVIFPVIAVIVLGYGTARRGVLSATHVTALNRFVFTLAAPALLFRNVALTEFPAVIPWGLWASYYGAMLVTMASSIALSFLFFAKDTGAERVITGFGGAFSNTVMLGIPIILTAFGMQAGLPLFLVLAFHGLLVFTIALIGLEVTTNPDMRLNQLPQKLGAAMRDQQVIIARPLCGMEFIGLGLAAPIDRFLNCRAGRPFRWRLSRSGGVWLILHGPPALGCALYRGV